MDYSIIDPNYKYDQLAETIYRRTVEHFDYSQIVQNLENAIASATNDSLRADLTDQLLANQTQMNLVEVYYNAAMEQIDDQTAYAAAVQRAADLRTSV